MVRVGALQFGCRYYITFAFLCILSATPAAITTKPRVHHAKVHRHQAKAKAVLTHHGPGLADALDAVLPGGASSGSFVQPEASIPETQHMPKNVPSAAQNVELTSKGDSEDKQEDKDSDDNASEAPEKGSNMRMDMVVIAITVLVTLSACYCASSMEVEEVTVAGKPDMIQNPVAAAGCRMLAQRPGLSCLILAALLFCTGTLSRHYDRLKTETLVVDDIDTRLADVHKAEQRDFPMVTSNSETGTVLIWTGDEAKQLQKNHDIPVTLLDLDEHLTKLKKEHSACKSLTWTGFRENMTDSEKADFLSPGNNATLLRLVLKYEKGEQNPRAECFAPLRTALIELDQKHSVNGVHVGMSDYNTLLDASIEQAFFECTKYVAISFPLMCLMLMVGVGTFSRAFTPLFVFLAATVGMRATMVIVKRNWRHLNFSGPDIICQFVMLALCCDYALFFWTRFSSERQKRSQDSLAQAVYRTLTSSGYVIILSMAVLILVNVVTCFFPNANNIGITGVCIELMAGMFWCGIYSMMLPAILISILPSIFDEAAPRTGEESWMSMRCFSDLARYLMRPWWTQKVGEFVTRSPWKYVVPGGLFICMLPLLWTLTGLKFSYAHDIESTVLPEYAARQVYMKNFDMDRAHPAAIFLQAIPLDDDHEQPIISAQPDTAELISDVTNDYSSHVTFAAEFGQATCRFVETMMKETQGEEYEIKPTDVGGMWWNFGSCQPMAGMAAFSMVGQCVHGDKEDTYCVPTSGTDQVMLLYKDVLNSNAANMIHKFWETIEPQANDTFTVEGKKYRFQANLDTMTAEEMLMAERDAEVFPWIILFAIVSVCCLVGSSFGSAFIMLKLLFTVFIPLLAEYGLLVGIYQHGWLEFLGVKTVYGIPWPLVFSTSPILVALALDYDMFLFARVYELRLEGYDNRSAVRIGLEETGPSITMAGSMMIVAFFFIFLTSIPVVSMTGCLYCLGVAMDTYVVRVWIAPSVLCMFESMNYWPAKMPPAVKDYAYYEKMCQGDHASPATVWDLKDSECGGFPCPPTPTESISANCSHSRNSAAEESREASSRY